MTFEFGLHKSVKCYLDSLRLVGIVRKKRFSANISRCHAYALTVYNEIRSVAYKLSAANTGLIIHHKLEMWANTQPDGRPAEHRWRPLFNAAKFG